MDLLPAISELSAARRAVTDEERKHALGQFFTPPEVAGFMASLVDTHPGRTVRVLDPGAGTGMLGLAAAHQLLAAGAAAVHLTVVESDPHVQGELARSMALLCEEFGARFTVEIRRDDFLVLDSPRLGVPPLGRDFDLAIANPPYFKMSPSEVLGGNAPNAYARFMEVAGRALRLGGQLVFIVPRSFASGVYFKQFRRRFHEAMAMERVHVFESRRAAFKEDSVLQENIIVSYRRSDRWPDEVVVSVSDSPATITEAREHRVSAATVYDSADPAGVIHLPTGQGDDATMRLVRSWPGSLRAFGLEISTGPVVAFRTDAMVAKPNGAPTVPMLWMQHVRPGEVVWPVPGGMRKPEHILTAAGEKLLVQNRTYVLMRRFSAKEEARRLTVAVMPKGTLPGEVIGLENHLNFIHRPGGTLSLDEAYGLGALLGSTLIDEYFRISNGNTQVNASEIRALPLPAHDRLLALGAAVRAAGPSLLARQGETDEIVARVLAT